MSNKLTVIIPIHKLDVEDSYIVEMFESLSKQDNQDFDILVATFADLKKQIETFNTFGLKLKFLDLPVELQSLYPNYTEVINFAVQTSVSTPYFTILQYDDVLNNTFVTYTEEYSKAYPNVSVFLPINLEFDGESFTAMSNELAWSMNYTQKQGFLDFETLKKLPIFSFAAAIYKTSEFIDNGGYKHSIKKYFEYEYFLRILHQLSEVLVIPKLMVRHRIKREGSLTAYYDSLDKLEMKFYQDLAKKEYFFSEDRHITYEG
jgi:glycosyltransferase involved in cell wall biosynthesis